MEKTYNVELLISLVKSRALLWDKENVKYMKRKSSQKAWREICAKLTSDFKTWETADQNVFIRAVMKKWVNLRATYNKYLRRAKRNRSGTVSKCMYADQLKFLTRRTTYRLPKITSVKSEYIRLQETEDSEVETEEKIKPRPPREEVRSMKRTSDLGMRKMQAAEESEDRHLSFFKSIAPTLRTFTDDESINFQMGVLQMISNIRQGRHSRSQSEIDQYIRTFHKLDYPNEFCK